MGVGGWGANHVKTLSRLRAEESIEDFIVIDIDKDRLSYISKLYGCRGYVSLDEALRKEDIEGLIIATPTRLHFEHAKNALERGLHVLVEKPMTTTSSEAKELIDIAKRNNRILMTGFLLRYSPAVQYLKERLNNNPKYFGELLLISVKRANPGSIRRQDVGVIRDLTIHDVDLAMYLFGAKPIRAYAYVRREGYEFEVFAAGFVDYDSKYGKFTLLFEASWIAPNKFRRWEISWTNKEVHLDLVSHKLQIYTGDEIVVRAPKGSDPLYMQDRNFIQSIEGKEKPLVTGADGYNALKVCEALLKSAHRNNPISIIYQDRSLGEVSN